MTTTLYPAPPIALVDLDDTLFQTFRRKQPEDNWAVATLDKDGQPLAFLNLKQQYFLGFLLSCTKPIPVTARSVEAFNRVKIDFQHGAVCSHGATILTKDGSLDQEWHSRIKQELSDLLIPNFFDSLLAHILQLIEQNQFKDSVRHWVVSENDLDIYFVIKQNDYSEENAFLHKLSELIDPCYMEFIYIHGNGNNLAFIPKCISKARAVEYLLKKIKLESPNIPVLGFGDSLSDLDFMFLADYACLPNGGQNQTWFQQSLNDNNINFG